MKNYVITCYFNRLNIFIYINLYACLIVSILVRMYKVDMIRIPKKTNLKYYFIKNYWEFNIILHIVRQLLLTLIICNFSYNILKFNFNKNSYF